jgi:hypothetical protein
MGRKLVIDGVQQAQSVLSGDIMDMQNAQALKYIFSADSKHFAHFAVSPSAATVSNGVFLDGKFIPTTSQGTGTDLRFSPDSKHLFWIHRYGDQPYRLFIDGKPLDRFYSPNNLGTPHWWDFAADGTLSLLAQDDKSLKRITITLPDATSLATMLGGGSAVAMGTN